MKKIIHLSDLHVGYEHCEEELKKIVKDIIDNRAAKDHVVVVTGDIVDNAKKDGSYELARKQFKKLEDKQYKVLVVPGNHDYGSGGKAKKKYVKLFKQAFYDDKNITYPKLDILDGIAFIGLDSMADTFEWLDVWGADGELGNKQLKKLALILEGPDVANLKKVVYLHHHPFDHRGRLHMLKDYRQFKAVIENKVDCLLFGHNHDGNKYPGVWGITQCFDGSSSTGKSKGSGKPATPYRVITLV
ncbi:metallophosphoesterase family protein [Desulfocicer niacini]